MESLFETIIHHVPCPNGDENGEAQVLVSTIDYNEYGGTYRNWKSRARENIDWRRFVGIQL